LVYQEDQLAVFKNHDGKVNFHLKVEHVGCALCGVLLSGKSSVSLSAKIPGFTITYMQAIKEVPVPTFIVSAVDPKLFFYPELDPISS
jgi:hypothetical protein